MTRRIISILALILFSSLAMASRPRKVIFDTDWWTDIDDACAVRILLDSHKQGDIDLMGICLSAVNSTSARSLDAFLRYEGSTGIPLGADKDATDYNGRPPYHQTMIDGCGYADLRDLGDCEDCVSFYRRLLSGAKGKVDIIAVGYPNALAKLLASGPDRYSRLSGKELVKKKVSHLWMMAGNYPEGAENNFRRTGRSRAAGALVCSEWPSKITFLGFETGIKVVAGGRLPEDDLLHKALAAHGHPQGRYAWDPMTTVLAINGDPSEEGYDTVKGTNIVDAADGSNIFKPSRNGRHRYVVMNKEPQWYSERLDSLLERKNK